MAEFEYESKYDDLAYDIVLKFITETYPRIKHRSLILIHALEFSVFSNSALFLSDKLIYTGNKICPRTAA